MNAQNVQVNGQNGQVNGQNDQSSQTPTSTDPGAIKSSQVSVQATATGDTAGPTVTGVTIQSARRKVTGVVFRFNESLATSAP